MSTRPRNKSSQADLSSVIGAMRLRLERAASVETAARPEPASDQLALPPALELLVSHLGLSPFELDVLMLCLAWELDTRVPALCAAAHGDPRKAFPTLGLALSLSSDPTWDALSPERPLRRWQIVAAQPTEAQPMAAWPLRADERILSFVKGAQHLDARWLPLLHGLPAVNQPLPPSQHAVFERMIARVQSAAGAGRLPVVQLVSRDPRSATWVAQRAATEFGLRLYRLDLSLLPTATAEVDLLLRLWERETLLSPVALLIDAESIANDAAPTLERVLSRASGLVFSSVRDARECQSRTCLRFDLDPPTAVERRQLWAARLPDLPHSSCDELAQQFVLGEQEIERVVTSLPEAAQADATALRRACIDATVPKLDGLARHIEPRASWDDLVLPEDELRTLHAMAAQVRHRATVYENWGFSERTQRGLALTALFAGESGTGKTLAAEVLARELQVPLLCIDLSAVIDKYIGETEKNLRRVFDAAEDAGALLFFDEADALFGKRSEVKDAHDRFANIEINYLLQRMEAYRGLAVLATNMKSALDAAFMRRLRFYVRFAFPAERERRVIWRRAFPSATPLEPLDYERLAAFALTGAAIRNVAINAAFLAAQARTPVTMALVLDAIRGELRKLDQRVNEAQFSVGAGTPLRANHGAPR